MKFYTFIMVLFTAFFSMENFGALAHKPAPKYNFKIDSNQNPYRDLMLLLSKRDCVFYNDEIKKIVKKKSSLINSPNRFGVTPLMSAALHGKVSSVKLFLSLIGDRDINHVCEKNRSALSEAVWRAHTTSKSRYFNNLIELQKQVEIVRMLLEKGANPNNIDHKGRPILYWAIKSACISSNLENKEFFYNHLEILRLLVRYNADLKLNINLEYRDIPVYRISDRNREVKKVIQGFLKMQDQMEDL